VCLNKGPYCRCRLASEEAGAAARHGQLNAGRHRVAWSEYYATQDVMNGTLAEDGLEPPFEQPKPASQRSQAVVRPCSKDQAGLASSRRLIRQGTFRHAVRNTIDRDHQSVNYNGDISRAAHPQGWPYMHSHCGQSACECCFDIHNGHAPDGRLSTALGRFSAAHPQGAKE
jgi:hypothetical protein